MKKEASKVKQTTRQSNTAHVRIITHVYMYTCTAHYTTVCMSQYRRGKTHKVDSA